MKFNERPRVLSAYSYRERERDYMVVPIVTVTVFMFSVSWRDEMIQIDLHIFFPNRWFNHDNQT